MPLRIYVSEFVADDELKGQFHVEQTDYADIEEVKQHVEEPFGGKVDQVIDFMTFEGEDQYDDGMDALAAVVLCCNGGEHPHSMANAFQRVINGVYNAGVKHGREHPETK